MRSLEPLRRAVSAGRSRWRAASGRDRVAELHTRLDAAEEEVREHLVLEELLAAELDRLERTLAPGGPGGADLGRG